MTLGTFSWICRHGVDHRFHAACQQCIEEMHADMFRLGRAFAQRMDQAALRTLLQPRHVASDSVVHEISLVRSLSPGVEPRVDLPPGTADNLARWIGTPPINPIRS